VRGYFKYLHERGKVPTNPATPINRPVVPDPEPSPRDLGRRPRPDALASQHRRRGGAAKAPHTSGPSAAAVRYFRPHDPAPTA
jgi:hypothetical protein